MKDAMETLKAVADQARAGDRIQQGVVVAFFRALSAILSDGAVVRHADGGALRITGPVRIAGRGQIVVRGVVTVGVYYSPYFLQGVYLEARTPQSRLFIDDGVFINNGSWIVSEGASISIGKRCLIGPQFSCVDTNGHDLALDRRSNADPRPQPVVIGDDVFIGDGVKILKGVTVGHGSIVAAGSVLFPGFTCPPNSTVCGNPAVIVRSDPEIQAS
jgi:maltose O-acetyltransferase